jgi:uncharacterized protein YbaR (Trm112 family)
MIDKEMLECLVCPKDHVNLCMADEELLARLNRAIAQGRLRNEAGRAVEDMVHAGLVRRDGKRLYPIVDDIPVLLFEE